MSNNGVEVLAERLHAAVELTMKEWDFSLAEAIGAIEVVKLEIWHGRIVHDFDDEDGEDELDK